MSGQRRLENLNPLGVDLPVPRGEEYTAGPCVSQENNVARETSCDSAVPVLHVKQLQSSDLAVSRDHPPSALPYLHEKVLKIGGRHSWNACRLTHGLRPNR